jgi:hypothetical protein
MAPWVPVTGRFILPRALAIALLVVLAAACKDLTGSGSPQGPVPPPPSTPNQDLGPGSPPVVWLGGTLESVGTDRIVLRQSDGSNASLQRLAESATKFLRISGGRWESYVPPTGDAGGQRACVETLMDGTNLVAIRVFVDVGCGPI